MNNNEPRVSFENEGADQVEATKTLKLDPKKSLFSKKAAVKNTFEERAQEVHSRMQGYLSEAFELGVQFKEFLEDKTVPSQMGALRRSREKEVIGKLVAFAIRVNNDQDENEGMGSVSILTLLLKTSLAMRDRYNELDYKYHELESYCTRLEAKLNKLSSQPGSHESK